MRRDPHATMTLRAGQDTATLLLGIVADLLRGNQHSRRTIGDKTGRSLPTADRWIEQIASSVPGVRRIRDGKTTWIAFDGRRDLPSKTAAVGACIAASLASVFEGSQQERNLKDARDYLLRLRRESYGDLDRKFFLAPKGGECALPEKREELDEVVDSLLSDRLLRFTYRHNDGTPDSLRVVPLSLVIFDHQFYVLCRRPDASLYAYRFARMNDVEADDERFQYPTRTEFDPRTLFGSIFGIHVSSTGSVEDVEVLLLEPWATYATTHRWHPTQQVQRLEGGRVKVTLRVRLCREVETWALAFGEHATVVRPDSLRERVKERLSKAASLYVSRPPVAMARVSKTGVAKVRSPDAGQPKAVRRR